MNEQMIQQLMAQYLRSQGGQDPSQAIQQQLMAQQQLAQPMQMGMGGFTSPQMPSGGMGSMQGRIAPQQGIIRGG